MVGYVGRSPRRLPRCHLDDQTTETPDVAASTIIVPAKHLGRFSSGQEVVGQMGQKGDRISFLGAGTLTTDLRSHEGNGALELTLEFSRHGGLAHHPGRRPKVSYPQMVA